jgi:hypothetical protein
VLLNVYLISVVYAADDDDVDDVIVFYDEFHLYLTSMVMMFHQ